MLKILFVSVFAQHAFAWSLSKISTVEQIIEINMPSPSFGEGLSDRSMDQSTWTWKYGYTRNLKEELRANKQV